ncbi:MAG TPA: hypothetical protein DIU15_08710, partial [Deltaproteobacteria bacterium]|nr:hypothetical protein [Deltaproteobacteria bacterium]
MAAPAPDLGQKFTCFKCECKFYDLKRPEPLCPRCGADQREDPTPEPKTPVKRSKRASKASPAAAKLSVETPVEDLDVDAGGAGMDDGDDLLDPMADDELADIAPDGAMDDDGPDTDAAPAKKAAAKKAPAKKAAAKKA